MQKYQLVLPQPAIAPDFQLMGHRLVLQVKNHGIPQSLIDEQFARSASFFALPEDKKAQSPFINVSNRGWEQGKQVSCSSQRPIPS